MTANEVERATGGKVATAVELSMSCVYGLGFPKTVTSTVPSDDLRGNFESNKDGYIPKAIPGLGADAYCITIAAIEQIPGGGRINVKLADGRLYQVWGTYSCDQLLPLAKIAVTRI